jgi:Spy/CpxP family protein refolding chaperone
MKLNKALVTVLLLTVFFAGAVTAEAGRYGRHQGATGVMAPGLHGLKTMIQLDLSDSQKLKIMSILEKYENQGASLKERLREARNNLTTVLKTEQADEDQIRSALRLAAPIKEELFVMRVRMMAELKTVLTPEQIQLLKQRRAHRIEKLKARIGLVPEDTSS